MQLTREGDPTQVVLSAPALDQSGTGSRSRTPTVLTEPCEFDTCPVGSPAEGSNASDRESEIFVLSEADVTMQQCD